MDSVAVSPVSAIASSYTHKNVVSRVYESGIPGQHKVVQDVYVVTIYDAMGKLSTVTTSHRVDFLV